MAETKRKGDIGEAMVMADALYRGYKVAMPVGEDWKYDLIILRNNILERVQCKFTKSDGKFISVKCRSTSRTVSYKYTQKDIDWIAVYDITTNKVYYLSASLLNAGTSELILRIHPTKNNQTKNIRWAKDFTNW